MRKNYTSNTEDEILKFIKSYVEKNGYSPSYKEIANSVGLKSSSSILVYLRKLKDKNKISYSNRPRTITLKKPETEFDITTKHCRIQHLKIDERILKNKTKLPVIGGCIYFLFKNKELVYIGQCKNGLSRVYGHLKDKKFDSYSFIPCNEKDLDRTEAVYINLYRPKYNKAKPTLKHIAKKHSIKDGGVPDEIA